MTEERQETIQMSEGTPRWLGVAILALAAVSLLGVGMAWSASNHTRDVQQASANDAKTLKQNLDLLSQRLAQSEAANAQMQGDLSVVTDRLKLTQGELNSSRHQTTLIKKDYSSKLAQMQDQVQGQLATKASADDVKAVAGDVNGVKSDLDATNQTLMAARSELGTQIAHNHDEVEQLRRLGQRDYYEFTLARKGSKQALGNVTLELRGTNTKHHVYTVNLFVDDMKLEKKNRSVNEPIFFYAHGSRSSMELVVNQVGKDKIVGYLSAPKVQTASATSPASGN
ncbi:MAG: hypothetical protein ACRD5L_13720 [Bryobacteraceae bacterium]